jgi:hypothetical protein
MMRWVLGACAVAAVVSSDARASVSIQVTWDGLLRESTAAVVATPVATSPVWENGRIYTYTHVHVDRPIAGALPGADAWIRTMGGVVGDVGQLVEGEAVLATGHTSLLFLHPGPQGAYVVTARGQGQFPVVPGADPKAPPHVVRSNAAGALVPPRPVGPVPVAPLAADVLHGRMVDDAAASIVADWDRTHGA